MPFIRDGRGLGWLVLAAGLMGTPLAGAAEPVTGQLTPKLDRLLRQEMRAIDGAMRAIFGALVSGNHAAVAEKARRIHRSFILQRELTAADRRDLKAAVPPAFLRLDKRFHDQAAALAEAARAEDPDRQLRLFQEMTGACIDCHRRYVSDRFPGLAD
jgi:mono/diheme cytochrome c family protein